jgi:hypothetical protein
LDVRTPKVANRKSRWDLPFPVRIG